jgi:predicted AlkP superfamily pyrophosphatase or phosphodiesterase
MRTLQLFAFAVLAYCSNVSLTSAAHNDRCVVLVSIDGLAGFYLDDPQADMPTLKKMAREGARADGMLCSFPTVTWPNHTTLVTGVPPAKHGVIGNNFFDRKTGKTVNLILDPVYDKADIIRVPTIYDVAHDAGLKTAGIIWPSTRNAKTIDFNAPDMPKVEDWETYGTASWIQEMREAGIPVDRAEKWFKEPLGGVMRDWMYTRMFKHVVDNHGPQLIMIHLVEVDHVEHKFGPRTHEAYWAVKHADDRLSDLLATIENSPWAGKTTFFICSDHGFYTIRREIRANVLIKKLGLADKSDAKRAWSVAQGGGCAVYVLDQPDREKVLTQLKEACAQLEGVTAVIPASDFAKIGQPTEAVDPHGADFWLSAKEGYSFSDNDTGDDMVTARESVGGTHGYLPEEPDLLGTCVVWGAHVKPGTNLGRMTNLDIAPTMAKVLGVAMPNVDGKVLPGIGE